LPVVCGIWHPAAGKPGSAMAQLALVGLRSIWLYG